MQIIPSGLLQNDIVKAALKLAWHDSAPSITGGHEEGGFILQSPGNEIFVQRWPVGVQNQISVPLHQNCRIDENDILASFHTHPNTGNNFLQEPSATDRRAVRDDPNLKGDLYVGEFVIANEGWFKIRFTLLIYRQKSI
ncbi:Mov34/MPN/PAD-1 family protein [Chloroflexi bacterium TSY]|nr:Mov34/MPN/PAD-1 family protein [Chloroflexi bacterium TSY]